AGVIASGNVSVPAMLAIYHWLRQRRAETEDLRSFAGTYALDEILRRFPPPNESDQPRSGTVAGFWQHKPPLLAATAPSDPDDRLQVMKATIGDWQWLPLVPPSFPLQTYAEKGMVFAWTPIPSSSGEGGLRWGFSHEPNLRPVWGSGLRRPSRIF